MRKIVQLSIVTQGVRVWCFVLHVYTGYVDVIDKYICIQLKDQSDVWIQTGFLANESKILNKQQRHKNISTANKNSLFGEK